MKNTYIKRQFIILLTFLVSLLIGTICIFNGLNTKKTITLKYQENNNIDYKVYLKENDFFEDKYIEKGKTYITSLIDYIHIDYQYNIEFDKIVDGDFNYKVMAKVEANKKDNEVGNYWTKEYEVTPLRKEKIKKTSSYSINQSVDIDYNEYNEILNNFKKTVGISNSDGILKIYLKVDSIIKGEKIKTPIDNELILELPLSQLAIEASINSDVDNKVNAISKTIKNNSPIYIALTILGTILYLLSISCLWLMIRNKRIYGKNHAYELKKKKILATYDSIIVNIKGEPDLEDYNIIDVESFEELIDAHSELRVPINCYEEEDRTTFVLLNEKTAWEYILEKNRRRRSAKR